MPYSLAELTAQGYINKLQFVAIIKQATPEYGSQRKLARNLGVPDDRLSRFVTGNGMHDSFTVAARYFGYEYREMWRCTSSGYFYTQMELHASFMAKMVQHETMVNFARRYGLEAEAVRKTKARNTVGTVTANKLGFIKEHMWKPLDETKNKACQAASV